MKFVNLTPHPLTIVKEDGESLRLPKAETPARCDQRTERIGSVEGIALYRVSFGEVIGLPESQPDTIYIVSGFVRDAVPSRTDVTSPGILIRDAEGGVIGAEGLTVN